MFILLYALIIAYTTVALVGFVLEIYNDRRRRSPRDRTLAMFRDYAFFFVLNALWAFPPRIRQPLAWKVYSWIARHSQ